MPSVDCNYKLPYWFRQEIPDKDIFERLEFLKDSVVHTVCQEARCPNLSFCFKHSSLTFLILGPGCTRNCRFCAVDKAGLEGGLGLDLNEPYRIAEVVRVLGLAYVVIT